MHAKKVTFDEFVAFQYFLKQKHLIINEVLTKGQIDSEGLREIADEFAEEDQWCQASGARISATCIGAFLCTMDLDGNHILDQDEVIGILSRKKDIGSGSLMKKGKK